MSADIWKANVKIPENFRKINIVDYMSAMHGFLLEHRQKIGEFLKKAENEVKMV